MAQWITTYRVSLCWCWINTHHAKVKPFENDTVKRYQLQNKYFKKRTAINKLVYKKQRIFCKKLNWKERKNNTAHNTTTDWNRTTDNSFAMYESVSKENYFWCGQFFSILCGHCVNFTLICENVTFYAAVAACAW